jgi:hypothetical protein
MFRILSILCIFSFLFYGIWSLYAPITDMNQKQISLDFDAYLEAAMSRNISSEAVYDVAFSRQDFSDEPIGETGAQATPSQGVTAKQNTLKIQRAKAFNQSSEKSSLPETDNSSQAGNF